jgi:hypothetical protein
MEAKVIKMNGVTLIEENVFSKHFKCNGIDLYLAKAVDEETDKHFLVVSIPHIAEVDAQSIQYPISFDTPTERDEAFHKFDLDYVKIFLKEVVDFINEQKEKIKE